MKDIVQSAEEVHDLKVKFDFTGGTDRNAKCFGTRTPSKYSPLSKHFQRSTTARIRSPSPLRGPARQLAPAVAPCH